MKIPRSVREADVAGKVVLVRADLNVPLADGRIAEIRKRPTRSRRAPPRGTELDCTGLILIPGLIQAHIHLCQTLFRGFADDLALEDWLARRIWPFEAAHTPETVYWSALLGAAELLLGGTTAILDMETVRHTDAAFQALQEIGLRATAGKCLMDAPGNPAALREPTDRALQEAADLCGRWHGALGGRLRYCLVWATAPPSSKASCAASSPGPRSAAIAESWAAG